MEVTGKKMKRKSKTKQEVVPMYNGVESLLGKKGGHRQRHGHLGEVRIVMNMTHAREGGEEKQTKGKGGKW